MQHGVADVDGRADGRAVGDRGRQDAYNALHPLQYVPRLPGRRPFSQALMDAL